MNTMNKHQGIKIADTTVAQSLTVAEQLIRSLARRPRRSEQTIAICAGHSLSAIRHAKQLLGVPTIEPRTSNQPQPMSNRRSKYNGTDMPVL